MQIRLFVQICLICLVCVAFVRASYADESTLDPVFSSSLDSSSPLFTSIMSELRKHEVVRASFKQEKTIAALSRPLISEGLFVFAKAYGVLWLQKAPFQSNLILTSEGSRFESHDMEASQQDTHPAIRRVSELFISLFTGEDKALKEQFTVQVAGTTQSWQLGLIPRSTMLKKFLSAIVLKGDTAVRQVTVFEGQGDRTHVSLATVTNSSSELTPEEIALLKNQKKQLN